jgi:hypothetical protein
MGLAVTEKLLEDKKRFASWRRNREKKGPIPAALWEVAVVHAKELGINRVCREFRLNHTQLKRKVQERGSGRAQSQTTAPSFVELAWPAAVARKTSEPVALRLVLERADGGRICVEGARPDLVFVQGLIGTFYGN